MRDRHHATGAPHPQNLSDLSPPLFCKPTSARFSCWAKAWPQFTCGFMSIFLGSEKRESAAVPNVAALRTEKVPGGPNSKNRLLRRVRGALDVSPRRPRQNMEPSASGPCATFCAPCQNSKHRGPSHVAIAGWPLPVCSRSESFSGIQFTPRAC